ncbi:MAG: hypothetical protein V1710_00215 [Candidatus Bathyarchaeota archaeon]
MSYRVKLTYEEVEALQREWNLQDESRTREHQIIQDALASYCLKCGEPVSEHLRVDEYGICDNCADREGGSDTAWCDMFRNVNSSQPICEAPGLKESDRCEECPAYLENMRAEADMRIWEETNEYLKNQEPQGDWKTLTYRDEESREHQVAGYEVAWTSNEAYLCFRPSERINWESRPMQWLNRKLSENGYKAKPNNANEFTIILPRGEKHGPVLGWTAWALYASKEQEKDDGNEEQRRD